jgi:hypothetical protein
MGNRANVVFVAGLRLSPAIYLHWNGGPESVYAFLNELDARGCRADADYEAARFVQIVGDFFDDDERSTLSLGITSVNFQPEPGDSPQAVTEALSKVSTDNSDNGFYLVDRTPAMGRTVRRFTLGYRDDSDYSLIEWDEIQVQVEHDSAIKSAHFIGITEILDGMRGKVSAYG